MRNTSEQKEQLLKLIVNTSDKLTAVLPESSQLKPLKELKEDIEQDYYTIMVVGEFKHGKSTFVNALLGQDIMPRDVTPTTATINAVFQGDQEVHIVKANGEVEKHAADFDILNNYTAASDFNPDEIKYIKLFLNSPLLQERMVLIDTPGVNDLSEQRAEVTHSFLPRADVVIFMSSLTAALKKSEQKFIEERLKKIGMDRVIFALNFMDRIDEDELDEVIDFAERRIQGMAGQMESGIFPISAKEALQGKLTGDTELLEYSGLKEIEAEVLKRLSSGSRNEEKLERFQQRLSGIQEGISKEILTAEKLAEQSAEELNTQLESVKEWLADRTQWEEGLQNYLYEREDEINFMVKKSFYHFGDRLKVDIENRIHLFQGADIKALVESQIPITIRTQFNQWVDQYSDHITQLFVKLEKEVSQGLSRSFQQKVQLQSYRGESLKFQEEIPILDAKSGNANVKAGMLLGGAGSLALLLGGPFFLPVMGMAGLPYISQKIAEKQLENIKPDLISSVHVQLDLIIDDFQNQLHYYVRNAINEIKRQSLEEFGQLIFSFKRIVQEQLSLHESEISAIDEQRERLKDLRTLLENERKEAMV
ncbi:MAG: dynamin family protein [Bacillota bacterium]